MFEPGASLENRLEAASRALEAARLLSPARLVAHPEIPPGSLEERREDVRLCAELWRAASETWPGHPPLALENTFQSDPQTLFALAAEIDRANVGLCFDVGHWHAFSYGVARKDLLIWMKILAPYLLHVHLHDNNGQADEHLGMGAGGVDWKEYAEGLKFASGPVMAALEPHSLKDYNKTLIYLEEHPEILNRIEPARGVSGDR
jgi:sugar phosphate isomerase/epimerase